MAETLGQLIARGRKEAGLSQDALARLVPGMTRSALNSIENGATKSISPDVANELVRHIPVTMSALLKAAGYEIPVFHSPIPRDLMEALEQAPEPVLDAVRMLLNGHRAMQQASRRSA